MTEPPSLASLSNLNPSERTRYGGKAVGLARLLREGLSTPPGFVISATRTGPDEWPDAFRKEFESRVKAMLEIGPIAIRSSAPQEDSNQRSFAGLFDSVLHIESVEDAVLAAETCIQSGGHPRVIRYSGSSQAVPVALIVQQMADARAAGVLFTRAPDGRDPALLIEAVSGTGEGLLGGKSTPERWRVYRNGLGQFQMKCDSESRVLTEVHVRALANVALSIRQRWKEELDLEWAVISDGSTRWLQARPITAGKTWRAPTVQPSAPSADDGPVTIWSNFNVRESLPEPLTPLGWSIIRDTMIPVLTSDLTGVPPNSPAFRDAGCIDLVNGRAYFNMNAMLAGPAVGRLLPRMLRMIDERAAATTNVLIREKVLRPRKLRGAMFWKTRARIGALVKMIRTGWKLRRPEDILGGLAEAGERLRSESPSGDADNTTLLRELRLLSEPDIGSLRDGLNLASYSILIWTLADRMFRPWPEARRLLAAGLPGNPTTEISTGIDELVESARPLARHIEGSANWKRLRKVPQLEAWIGEFDRFLDRNGHRGPMELDIGSPRWKDDPTMILELIRSGLRAPDREPVRARLKRLRKEREEKIERAIHDASGWKRPLLRWLSRAVASLMPLREAPKHHHMQCFRRSRDAALELGRRLKKNGRLPSLNDVFFLEIHELESLIGGDEIRIAARLAERKKTHTMNSLVAPPDFIRSDGVPVPDSITELPPTDGSLAGLGIGGGIGEGPARVLHTPNARRVHPGDVLVMKFADPGWTPLFPAASAVVMEVGGSMCHAAVIARELGIPAVFGVKDATTKLKEGRRIRVDGDQGIVSSLS